MQTEEITKLATFLRNEGDIVLNGKCKLSLTSSILHTLNNSFTNILKNDDLFTSCFHVLNSTDEMLDTFIDLHFLYEFFRRTVGLKLIPCNNSDNGNEQKQADIHIFENLKLLEVQRFSLNLIKGIKSLRAQLQYLTCMRSLNTINEVLENCGGDRTQGLIWNELKAAAFCHNNLESVDASFEFTPRLESLDLSYNRIENVQHINCLLNLKYLNLSFNKIKMITCFNSRLCDTLEILILRHNYIEDIRDLKFLINLRQLDLAYNLLINHDDLNVLSSMPQLNRLNLDGNPLYYHNEHRLNTVKYLHSDIINDNFKLDNVLLARKEIRMVASVQYNICTFDRSSSINSVTTANTVIQVQPINRILRQQFTNNDNVQTSDMEVSATSIVSQISEDIVIKKRDYLRYMLGHDGNTSMHESQGMQDSGIVARPASPSESSIGKLICFITNSNWND